MNNNFKKMHKQFLKLLSIHGVSGQETNVRNYLQPIMQANMDEVVIDKYGNLLSTKKIGSGKGATVILSAHMDTVTGVVADRKVLENNGVITSDKGALGADDRGGIAIILEVLRNMDKLGFEGTLKIAFSREEEIGCVGASKIDPKWYEGADLAIVVDRRGNRDIVVGCYGAFCSDEVGHFMENCSALQEMDWQCVEGGISDARIFSENGINSVNLSAGYMNEHTAREFAVFEDMCDTVRLILQVFGVINDHCHKFGEVPQDNQWVDSYLCTGKSSNKYYCGEYYEDNFSNDYVYAEEFDAKGDVYIYDVGKEVVIQQGETEILLSRSTLKSLVNQLKKVL